MTTFKPFSESDTLKLKLHDAAIRQNELELLLTESQSIVLRYRQRDLHTERETFLAQATAGAAEAVPPAAAPAKPGGRVSRKRPSSKARRHG